MESLSISWLFCNQGHMKNNFATAVCVKLELEVAEVPQSQTGQYPGSSVREQYILTKDGTAFHNGFPRYPRSNSWCASSLRIRVQDCRIPEEKTKWQQVQPKNLMKDTLFQGFSSVPWKAWSLFREAALDVWHVLCCPTYWSSSSKLSRVQEA